MRDEVYVGALFSEQYLAHYGVGHLQGGHSGRYPWGSGKRPKQKSSNVSSSIRGLGNVLEEKVPDDARHLISDALHVGLKGYQYYSLAASALAIPINPIVNIPFTGYYGWAAIKDMAALIKAGYIEKRKNGEVVDKRTGFKLKAKACTAEEDCKDANPLYAIGSPKRTNNCMLCTATYDMRRRGYDVTAKTSYDGYSWKDYKRWYPKAICWTTSKKDIVRELKAQGNGARGNLMVQWDLPIISDLYSYGHSVAYEIENNDLVIRDAQTGKTYRNPNKFLKHIKDEVDYIRLDNRKFDPKAIKECCE